MGGRWKDGQIKLNNFIYNLKYKLLLLGICFVSFPSGFPQKSNMFY